MGPQKAPNAAERDWISAIRDFGCVACYADGHPDTPAVVHHIVEANRRLGHRWSLPLCCPGHHQRDSRSGKISLHPGRSPHFIERYGTELELLARLEDRLGFLPAPGGRRP